MGTLINMFQKVCFVEMAADQDQLTTGYGDTTNQPWWEAVPDHTVGSCL